MTIKIENKNRFFRGITIGDNGATPFRVLKIDHASTSVNFNVIAGGGEFNNVYDPVMYLGWNILTGGIKELNDEAMLGLAFEQKYRENGKNYSEFNLEFRSAPGSGSHYRPMGLIIDQDSPTNGVWTWGFRIGDITGCSFSILDSSGTTTRFSVDSSGNAGIMRGINFTSLAGGIIQHTITNGALSFVANNSTKLTVGGTVDIAGIRITSDDGCRIIRSASGTIQIPYHFEVGGTMTWIPSGGQSITSTASTILANARIVQISANGVYTLASVPTIADGKNGQRILIVNYGSNNITLQDHSALSNTNLRLKASSITLAPRNSVEMVYLTSIGGGEWVQVGEVITVL